MRPSLLKRFRCPAWLGACSRVYGRVAAVRIYCGFEDNFKAPRGVFAVQWGTGRGLPGRTDEISECIHAASITRRAGFG